MLMRIPLEIFLTMKRWEQSMETSLSRGSWSPTLTLLWNRYVITPYSIYPSRAHMSTSHHLFQHRALTIPQTLRRDGGGEC